MSSPVDHIYRRAGNETSDIAESYVEKIPGDCQGVGTAGSLGEQSQLFGFGLLPVESHAGTCVESRP